ncbi:sigma-70 family RNA polymerase sigma factor [Plantactinospora sp. WMMC1484]|uniref:sigma-70 family RNA polymerase sigma factor n=1 Tax=Plantactinospora sp. WMMC1484 TaxID=3404122 RepID=UPI003BF58074
MHSETGPRVVADTGPPRHVEFEEFYATCFQPLTVQLFAYTGDLGAAQDLVQEAFVRALARWTTIAHYDDPAAWVRRVAWNLATSRWRRARTAARFLQRQRAEHAAAPSPDRVALAAALRVLPGQQRRAVILHYLADLPVGEIARQDGVAEATVRSWLHRGRKALAAQLSEQGKRDG